jgi:hypothetical protein
MTKRVFAGIAFAAIVCLSYSTAARAQITCGIGTSVKKFNKVAEPTDDDFTIPLKVITNGEAMKAPFYYCDANLDLRPGIRFLDVYIDSVLATGRTLQDPSVLYIKKLQKEMKAAINKEGDLE